MIRFFQWGSAKLCKVTLTDGEHLRDVTGKNSKRVIAVSAYGVDTKKYTPVGPAQKQELRKKHDLPQDAELAIFSSRVAPEKDPETVLKAVKQLRQEGRDLQILHLSGGWQDFHALATTYGLADITIAREAVHPMHELFEFYQASDVCIQASRAEGCGWSPIEATACGVPAVASNVGGLSRTMPELGWVFHAGDEKDLTEKLRRILSEPKSARVRALQGRELIKARWDSQVVFDEMAHQLSLLVGTPDTSCESILPQT